MSEMKNPQRANTEGESKDSNSLSGIQNNVSADVAQDVCNHSNIGENEAGSSDSKDLEKNSGIPESSISSPPATTPVKAPTSENIARGRGSVPAPRPDLEKEEFRESAKNLPPNEGKTLEQLSDTQPEDQQQPETVSNDNGRNSAISAENQSDSDTLAERSEDRVSMSPTQVHTVEAVVDSATSPYGADELEPKLTEELEAWLKVFNSIGVPGFCPWDVGGRWYDDGDRVEGTFYTIVVQQIHPVTGTVLMTEEQIEAGLAAGGGCEFVYILHDKDRYVEGEKIPEGRKVGDLKPPHWHILLKFDNKTKMRLVGRRFKVEIQSIKVRPAKDWDNWLLYILHASKTAMKAGKHQYSEDEVTTSITDFPKRIEKIKAKLAKRAEQREAKQSVEDIIFAVKSGELTVEQVDKKYPRFFCNTAHLDDAKKLRKFYLTTAPAPEKTTTILLSGEGGAGKTEVAIAIAKLMFPDVQQAYFVVGADNVSFDMYDGQPVVIWDDFRPHDMVKAVRDRGTLLRLLDPHKDPNQKVILNVKHTLTNCFSPIHIITTPDTPETFCDGIVGQYESVDKYGNAIGRKAENRHQSYRRIPIFVDIRGDDFDIRVSRGIANGTREYFTYDLRGTYLHETTARYGDINQIADSAEKRRAKEHLSARAAGPIATVLQEIHQGTPGTLTAEEVLAKWEPRVGQSADDLARAEGYADHQAKVEAEQKAKAEAERKVEVDSALQEVKNRGLNYYVLDAAMDWCRGTESGDASPYLQVNNAAEVYVAPVHPAIRYDDFAPVELRWLREYPQQFKPYCEVTDPRILDHHQRLNRVLSYQEFVDEMSRFQSTYKVADSEMHHLYQRPFTRWYLGATVPSRSVAKATPPPADELARVLTLTQPQQEQSA